MNRPVSMEEGERMVQEEFLRQQVLALSKLYQMLCTCRKLYKELDQLLDPDFHLTECEYNKRVKPLGIKFERKGDNTLGRSN